MPSIGPDGSIYIQSYSGAVLSLVALTQNGIFKWAYTIAGTYYGGNILSQPAIGSDGTIYFTGKELDSTVYIYALNSDGSQRWKNSQFIGKSTPCIDANGNVHVATSKGMYTFSPVGNELSRWTGSTLPDVRSSSPVITDGLLWVGAYSSGLWHSTEGVNLAAGTWSMFQGNPRHTGNFADIYIDYYALTVVGGGVSGSYTNGARVTITATSPAVGKIFDRWTGATQYVASVASSTTTVTMPAQAITLTATYITLPRVSIVVAAGGGSVSPSGDISASIGGSLTLTATPNPSYKVKHWLVNGEIRNAGQETLTLTNITANTTVSVVFEKIKAMPWLNLLLE
jgi:hypothetical protein